MAVPLRKMFPSTDTQKNGEQQFLIKKVFEVAGIKLRTSKLHVNLYTAMAQILTYIPLFLSLDLSLGDFVAPG